MPSSEADTIYDMLIDRMRDGDEYNQYAADALGRVCAMADEAAALKAEVERLRSQVRAAPEMLAMLEELVALLEPVNIGPATITQVDLSDVKSLIKRAREGEL